MSWKGTSKAFGRMPQQVLSKTGIRSATKDRRFEDVNSQFNELTKMTEKFHSDVIKFRDSMSNMINYQANTADLLVELYENIQGEGSSEGSVTRRVKTPARSMKAVETYSGIMSEIRDLVLPELDTIDVKVVEPAVEFMKIIKAIKKTVTKRDHKKVDYDRYKLNLTKLQEKKERSLSDEKQMFKLEEQFDQATQDYEYYNDILKKELPLFFEYRVEFIEPVVESFYNIQLNIYGILLERFEQLVEIGYFDTESDLIRHFESRKEESHNLLEELTIIDRRKQERLTVPQEARRSRSSDTSSARSSGRTSNSNRIRSHSPDYRTTHSERDHYDEDEDDDAPPEYTPTPVVTSPKPRKAPPEYSQKPKIEPPAYSSKPVVSIPKPKKAPPPRPPIAPKPKLTRYVIALYDYDAQADGDLSFRKDDKIEVVERTPDVNDWWKGRLNGKVGMFPGDYKIFFSISSFNARIPKFMY
ncbi:14566_t:CDS:2 [Acaulospora morrowiae]|uniref:14566_t:CDS:1 n=1 Tax=Acaulospora morrowiae TaxID=94023 RepID=A0A9N8ZRV8_9GLOM|nr:14566_t:CDS:2 [Acaulospora morrowiae]